METIECGITVSGAQANGGVVHMYSAAQGRPYQYNAGGVAQVRLLNDCTTKNTLFKQIFVILCIMIFNASQIEASLSSFLC